MKALQQNAILPSNLIYSPNTTSCDSRQTTNRKVSESDKATFCDKVLSKDSLQQYLGSNESALNAVAQNVAQKTEKTHRKNVKEKENSNWLKQEMEKFQQTRNKATEYQNKNEKLHHKHARRQSSCEEKTPLSLNNSSDYSSIRTFLQKKAEPLKNVTCNFCNTTLFKQSLKESIRMSQQTAQIQIQNKLFEENSRLKAALEDMLDKFQESRASEDNLNEQIQQLRFDLENQTAFSNRLVKEQREMRGLLNMYEQLLTKMSEQNQKLKDWMKSRKLKDKKKREKRQQQRDTSVRTSNQNTNLNTSRRSHPEIMHQKGSIPGQLQFSQIQQPPRTNRSPVPDNNLSWLTPLTYREISAPKTMKLLDTKSTQDLNKTQVKKTKPEPAGTYRPRTVTAFCIDDHIANFENRAESTFGQGIQIDQNPDGYSYPISRSPSPHDKNMKNLYHKISQSQENDFQKMREEVITSMTSLETSFRQLNVKPNYNYYA